MAVLAGEQPVPDPPHYTACIARLSASGTSKSDGAQLEQECRSRYQALQRRALEFLISSDWLIQEAAAEHLSLSEREIEERVNQNAASGETGLRELLDKTPPTKSDLELEAAAQLASAKIRQAVVAAEPPITSAQTATYYRQHRRDFLLLERRYFEIVNLKSDAAARKVKREVEAGTSFASVALREERSSAPSPNPGRAAIDRAIFSAKPNVLSGPVLLSDLHDHSLFEVTKIVPARYQSLAEVKGQIASKLAVAQQQRTLAEFTKAWIARWIARTDCRAGYVVPRCRQYGGSPPVEATLGVG